MSSVQLRWHAVRRTDKEQYKDEQCTFDGLTGNDFAQTQVQFKDRIS